MVAWGSHTCNHHLNPYIRGMVVPQTSSQSPKKPSSQKKTAETISGVSPDRTLVECIELSRNTHPYFIATQAHPEFLSRVEKPHPLFVGLIRAGM